MSLRFPLSLMFLSSRFLFRLISGIEWRKQSKKVRKKPNVFHNFPFETFCRPSPIHPITPTNFCPYSLVFVFVLLLNVMLAGTEKKTKNSRHQILFHLLTHVKPREEKKAQSIHCSAVFQLQIWFFVYVSIASIIIRLVSCFHYQSLCVLLEFIFLFGLYSCPRLSLLEWMSIIFVFIVITVHLTPSDKWKIGK